MKHNLVNYQLIVKIVVIISFVLSFSISQQVISIQLNHGYNKYISLDHYFNNYERVTISDLLSQNDHKQYHSCVIGQQKKSQLQLVQTMKLIGPQNNDTTEVMYDLDEVIKLDKIISSHYNSDKNLMYILTSSELRVISVQGSKIKQNINIKLINRINDGKLVELESKLFIVSEYVAYYIQERVGLYQLKLISELKSDQIQRQQQYVSIFMNRNNQLVIVTGTYLSVHKLNNNEISAINNNNLIKRQFNGFQGDIQNLFYYSNHNQQSSQPTQQSKQSSQLLLVFDQQQVYLSFNINLSSSNNLTINQQTFYKFQQTNKCRYAKNWTNYLILQCKNHIKYINTQQLLNCYNINIKNNITNNFISNNQNNVNNEISKCINNITTKHINVGYHIQSIQLIDHNKLIIVGIDKYWIKYIQTNQINNNQIISSYNTIKSIVSLATYYPNRNLKNIYLIKSNQSLIISKSSLSIANQIPQQKQIFCKTVNQINQQPIDQPIGKYNATITIQGFCQYMINQSLQINAINGDLCQLRIPLQLNIISQVKTYQFLWYIFISLIAIGLIGVLFYFFIKNRKLKQQYKIFQDQNQHGQQVIQQTMITQNNHQITLEK